ncbi:tetratricopeptide repeat protein [Bacteroidales bacterium OttesenSCG-928-K22]|nr:tetratricopeptide repeat protein [Bacteroidales bacterium OttesenSCG-928-L14]MDL2240604.1 tetratricopeptide repeat protein [Bacteroidales bacterium OttesenSCG-928-K22]
MQKFLLTLFLALCCSINLFAQLEGVLKPSEIYAPLGSTPAPKPQVDERSLSYQYYSNGEFDKAATLFERFYDKSNNYNNYRYLLYSYIGLKDYDKAEKLVKKQQKQDKTNPERYYVDLGYIDISRGYQKNGIKLYDEAISKMKGNEQGVRLVAGAFIGLREHAYAIKAYNKGREILKNPLLFSNELANIYYSRQDYPKMVEEYLNYVEYQPQQLNYVYGRFQDYMSKDPDDEVANALKNVLLSRAQKEKEGTFYNEMSLWFFIQIKEFELAYSQAISIDKKGNKEGMPILDLASICLENNIYDVAIKCYKYLLTNYKNHPIEMEAEIGLLNTEYRQFTSKIEIDNQKLNELDKLFSQVLDKTGINTNVLDVVISYSEFKAYYQKDYDGAVQLLEPLLNVGRPKAKDIARIKICLGDIYLLSGDQWEATLLYSQVEKQMKDDPLGHEAKFKNAELFYYMGEFNWAETKLDILKSSTGKLIANDAMQLSLFIKDNKDEDSVSMALSYFAKADLAFFKREKKEALLYLDSAANVNAWSPIEDDVLYKKAEIYLSMNDYITADSLLAQIGEKYSYEIIADEALYLRAYINDKFLNKRDDAQQMYQDLFLNYPESVYAIAARNRFRELRGDVEIGEDPEYLFFNNIPFN